MKLDALLEELEALDKKRTSGPFSAEHVKRLHAEYFNIQQPDTDLRYVAVHSSKEDAAFIVAAVNTNAKLREIIRVQREALQFYAERCPEKRLTPVGFITDTILLKRLSEKARQAIEAVEKLIGEGMQ